MYASTLNTKVLFLQWIYTLIFTQLAFANVEKTIFIAPAPSTVPTENSAIDDLGLDRLSPTDFMLRTTLNASFPTADEPLGLESWFYLEDLNPGQRYEVRICWLATQPTSFSLTTYPLQEIISDTSLFPAVLKYSDTHLTDLSSLDGEKENYHPGSFNAGTAGSSLHTKARPQHIRRSRRHNSEDDPLTSSTSQAESILFLRIFAAADYFTTDQKLMNEVPPVIVDIILDPFLGNIFPRSLVPTALYTVVIAVIAYFVGGFLARALTEVGARTTAAVVGKEKTDNDGYNNANANTAGVEHKKRR